jgi:succinate dehydrogenase / fumarate reductase cytochrome b subunit
VPCQSFWTDNKRNKKMTTKAQRRPVFLDLLKIRLPVAGLMSIGHRITGVVMVLAIPALIYLLDVSVSGPEGFAAVSEMVTGLPFKLVLFLALWALMHHFLAGIRYLLLDVDVGVESPMFRHTALAVLAAAPLLALLLTGVLS